MEYKNRHANRVLNHFINNAPSFDFFQAVCLLEKHFYIDDEKKVFPIGYHYRPSNEFVRFKSTNSLGFPLSGIKSYDSDSKAMHINFMGLSGQGGVLPDHYTELLLHCLHLNDTSLRDFFDLFNHRLISLFYRSWEKPRLYINYSQTHYR